MAGEVRSGIIYRLGLYWRLLRWRSLGQSEARQPLLPGGEIWQKVCKQTETPGPRSLIIPGRFVVGEEQSDNILMHFMKLNPNLKSLCFRATRL